MRNAPATTTTTAPPAPARKEATIFCDESGIRLYFYVESGSAAGKVADAEIHFMTGPLAGLKLIGFGVWQRRNSTLNVTFPARQYSVAGERRSFALLRPIVDVTTQERLRDLIVYAFKETPLYVERSA